MAALALWGTAASCNYPSLPPVPQCGRPEELPEATGYLVPAAPSCTDLTASCGPDASRSCCEAAVVPGGTFHRGCDNAADDLFVDVEHPATIGAFVLDRYEVTIGRFRKFVSDGKGTQEAPPPAGAGAHPRLPASGWDSAWNAELVADTATLIAAVKCDSKRTIWTDSPGDHENWPISCVTWYEAVAFCIWDGGYLPTEAEWSFAAAGGSDHRAFPWSTPADSTDLDCTRAKYQSGSLPVRYCGDDTLGVPQRVGSVPAGDGRWGHSDLAGNVYEWTLDWYTTDPPLPCTDCAALALPPDHAGRVLRGGGFFNEEPMLRAQHRLEHAPVDRVTNWGFRCARTP